MTWTIYELARHPEIQAKLQADIDEMLAKRKDVTSPLEYRDVHKSKYLTKVLNETLRLWNVVPKGPRREFQFDDVISGPNGEDVPVKKGTTFAVPHVVIHKNPQYWGDSAGEYNPDVRDFSSKAFMPFTLPPRDCIGRNFALMEVGVLGGCVGVVVVVSIVGATGMSERGPRAVKRIVERGRESSRARLDCLTRSWCLL